jgi:hypothetical protein
VIGKVMEVGETLIAGKKHTVLAIAVPGHDLGLRHGDELGLETDPHITVIGTLDAADAAALAKQLSEKKGPK